jgi:hypothetical protein
LDNGRFLPGTQLPIIVQAFDPNSIINRIQYFVNDSLVANAVRDTSTGDFTVTETGTSAALFTYQFPFAGDYRIYAQARDQSGLIAQSQIVTINVREPDPTQPVVVMSHPLPVGGGDNVNDVSIGSTMFLNAIADDDTAIDFVRFFINGQLIGSSTTNFRGNYSLFYRPTSPGDYIIFAEAVDITGQRAQSVPLQLGVFPLQAQLPIVEILPLAESDRVVDAGSEITISAVADGGLVDISQINFYVNGVFFDGITDPSEDGVYTTTVELDNPGQYQLNVRAVEIDPLGLNTDNWVISDPVSVLVNPVSSNRTFVLQTYQDYFGTQPSQAVLDAAVGSLDNLQISQAQYINDIIQSDAFDSQHQALMARYLLTGNWPNRDVLFQDVATINSGGLTQLVSALLPTFQRDFWNNQRIPDGFSSESERQQFFDLLFVRKYSQDPAGDQSERGTQLLGTFGAEEFIAEFIRDVNALPFGNGSISEILGIPNPPNTLLSDWADTASLYANLLRVTPSHNEVTALSTQILILQIETILADPRYTSR